MSDHRALQRTLFRMQADPGFAEAFLAGEGEARASTGLGAADLALLAEVDPLALVADRDGKRRAQMLGNLASEFTLSLALAARDARTGGLLADFPASAAFHDAVVRGERLPLVFGTHARERARRAEFGWLEAVAGLELAMAELRRAELPAGSLPARGHVALAPGARLAMLAAGTLELAGRLRAALDTGRRPPPASPEPATGATETALLVAGPKPRHGLAEVHAEPLTPPADALFRELARGPMDAARRAAFAREHGARAAELEAFVEGFVTDGVLLRGA